jgi:BirA family transcriptional regulator, biotin operon repressor / biotin---[acetyl-CoA-carboxylase] ligase
MGRVWDSANGNLFASTIVRLRGDDPPASSLGFVTALSVHQTVRLIAPDVAILIKWPNDLLTQAGEKICGILLERSGDAVIVGIGLNLRDHPDGLERPVSDLTAKGANPPQAQAVVEMLADAFARQLAVWRGAGLAAILRAWQDNAHPHGTALSVRLPNGENHEGLYAGLAEDGALKLRLANGEIRAIHAADIFLI